MSQVGLRDDPTIPCYDGGDTAWMLVSTLLVLGMVPALAFFEAGMLRSKNTLSLVTQMFSGVVALSVMWVFFGYSLTFGPDQGGFIGDLSAGLWVNHVSYSDCDPSYAPTIPIACFALFQMMFAAITPLLITGAFAERMKFKVFFPFVILWEFFVYYPVAHWIWGHGFLHTYGTLDFAGGIVIHTTAGMASFICAIMIGKRVDFELFHGEFPASNLPMAAIGAALLWMGWFGFNGGSALGANHVAVSALVSTQIGCSVSALVWLMLSWYRGKPSAIALLNGAVAGLAGITPASGYINTPATIAVAIVLGVASYWGAYLVKQKLHIDDALDVSMVHGLTGVIGSLAVGIFSDSSLNPNGADGVIYGNSMQLWYQLAAVLLAGAWSAFWTVILLKVLGYACRGIRVGREEEEIGLDYAEHSEIAYHNLHVLDDSLNHGESHGSKFHDTVMSSTALTGTETSTNHMPLLRPHSSSLSKLPRNQEYRRVDVE